MVMMMVKARGIITPPAKPCKARSTIISVRLLALARLLLSEHRVGLEFRLDNVNLLLGCCCDNRAVALLRSPSSLANVGPR